MTHPHSPSSAPAAKGAVDASDRPRLPTREELDREPPLWLHRGGRTKADLRLFDQGGRTIVIKDFAHKAFWVRWAGRLQISRECGAYARIEGVEGPPRWLGRIDRHALALERIEGEDLARAPDRQERAEHYLAELTRIVRALHARGLAHLDLRGRDNVMVDRDGRVRVLDFAAALWLRPAGFAHRWFFDRVKLADEAALLKWKRLLGVGPYTAEEAEFLRRWGFWRSLWVFNRKVPLEDRRGRAGR